MAARSTVKVTGKIKAAVLSGQAMNSLMWGQSLSTGAGQIAWNVGTTFTLSTGAIATPGSGASTVTSTGGGLLLGVGSTAIFDADLGVTFVNSGLPGRRVSTGLETSSGLYSIGSSAGVNLNYYYFSQPDTTTLTAGTTNPIKITYSYSTAAAGTGTSSIILNQPIGFSPTFQLDYYTNLNQPAAKPFVVRCYAGIGAKIAMAFKLEDFMMPEYDFDLYADNSGRLWNLVSPENA